MRVREFGDTYNLAAIAVTATWCAPSQLYACGQQGGV
jgi:hypothetical protein